MNKSHSRFQSLFPFLTHDENSRIIQNSIDGKVVKACNEGYRLNNGDQFIDVICNSLGEWTLTGTLFGEYIFWHISVLTKDLFFRWEIYTTVSILTIFLHS